MLALVGEPAMRPAPSMGYTPSAAVVTVAV
jgi:hypothetical protein